MIKLAIGMIFATFVFCILCTAACWVVFYTVTVWTVILACFLFSLSMGIPIAIMGVALDDL